MTFPSVYLESVVDYCPRVEIAISVGTDRVSGGIAFGVKLGQTVSTVILHNTLVILWDVKQHGAQDQKARGDFLAERGGWIQRGHFLLLVNS